MTFVRPKIYEVIQYISPQGDVFSLQAPPSRIVWGIAGLGLSPNESSTVRGPYQQGQTTLSRTLTPRLIEMSIRHKGCSRDDFWSNRQLVIDLLRENQTDLYNPTPGTLRFKYLVNGDKVARDIDVFLVDDGIPLTSRPEDVWDNFAVHETIAFRADYPIFYDPTALTSYFGSLVGQLQLSASFPFVLGAYQQTKTITYTGTWEEYPTIVVTGPAKDITIENLDTGLRINLAYEVGSEEVITYNLDYNYKTVTSDCFGDITKYVVDYSQLSSFSIQCDPQVAGGTNRIRVTSSVFDPGQTTVVVNYYNRYRGI